MRNLILIIFLFASVLCHAQYTKQQMYDAYLTQNMRLWDKYLHAHKWTNLSTAEKSIYINYEYGYIATAIDEKQPDAKQHIEVFLSHINDMSQVLPEATILVYKSSYAAYRAKAYTMEFASQGLKAMNIAKDAVRVDSLNPLALTLYGCVEFYAPKLFGGNKHRALQAFTKAEYIYKQTGDTINNWNYISCQMQRAMCLEKIGNKTEAIALCKKILQDAPNFIFIRDTYLPSLLK